MRALAFAAILLALGSATSPAHAAVVYDEAINGAFSDDNLAPTPLGQFLPGVNQVTGRVTDIGIGGFNFTNDVFTFEIPANSQLVSITMSSFSTSSGGGMYMMLSRGATFPFDSIEVNDKMPFPDLMRILGGSVVGGTDVGADVLDNLQAAGARGDGVPFTTPLGPGNYSVYLQETSTFSNYSLGFNVTAIPEPSTWAVLGIVGGGAVIHRRRKQWKSNA